MIHTGTVSSKTLFEILCQNLARKDQDVLDFFIRDHEVQYPKGHHYKGIKAEESSGTDSKLENIGTSFRRVLENNVSEAKTKCKYHHVIHDLSSAHRAASLPASTTRIRKKC